MKEAETEQEGKGKRETQKEGYREIKMKRK